MNKGLLMIGILLGNLILTVIVMILGYRDAAWWISNPGTWFILLGFLAYGVLFDSKKRWPHLKTWDRFSRILTFGR
ncbi:hypothetical protein LCGC14_1118930 [marine sediment metagenome]|uniref:Uncharacterized protein n=1 Tax=marine sediment metagenome TaxID=412755 RepID=A0A0F9M9D8_9ZZZZ